MLAFEEFPLHIYLYQLPPIKDFILPPDTWPLNISSVTLVIDNYHS